MATIRIKNNTTGFIATIDSSAIGQYPGWTQISDSSTAGSTQPTTQQQEQSKIPTWYISSWTYSGNQWNSQPVLTIDGVQYKFATPQEYVNKMNSAGITDGQSSLFKQQFQSAQNDWNTQASSTNTSNTGNASTSTSAVNSLYQKYFSRNATPQELSYWSTQPASSLETDLNRNYKNASGIDYDGSPIVPGKTTTVNQASGQATGTQPTGSTITAASLLSDPRVKSDLGVNGATMSKWISGNSALIPQLAARGYTVDDLINEAYSQVHYNKSAFSNDMTTTSRENNTAGAGTTPAPVTPTDQSGTGNVSDSAVNTLYQKYFGRDATSAETVYWKSQGTPALEKQLAQDYKNASGINYDGTPILKGQTVSQNQYASSEQERKTNEYINSLSLDETQKIILRTLAKQEATSGTKFYKPEDVDKLIKSAADAATADLSPYYEKITTQEIQDLKNKMSDLRGQAARYSETSAANYAATLDKTRKSLRAQGLTFSGIQRKVLGGEGAINSAGVEGLVPQARRYDYAEKSNAIQEQARDAGIAAERKLGSGALNNLQGELGAIADPYAGEKFGRVNFDKTATKPIYKVNEVGTPDYVKVGDFDLDKKKAIEQSKWSRISSLNQYLQ